MFWPRAEVEDPTGPPFVRKKEIEGARCPIRSNQIDPRAGKARNGTQRIASRQPQQLMKIVELAHPSSRAVVNHRAEPINRSGYRGHRCQRDLLRFEFRLLIRIQKLAGLRGFLFDVARPSSPDVNGADLRETL